MTAATNQDFKTFQGDDVAPVFTVRDSSGNAIDISTVNEIEWYCQQNQESGVALSLKKSTGGIVFVGGGTTGQFQVNIPRASTATLDGWYQHLSRITDGLGKVTTVEVGRMQVGVRPTWTYNAVLVGVSPLNTVRRMIGDVLLTDQQLMDVEILYFISIRSNYYGAAAECCRAIASQAARKVDTTVPSGHTQAAGTISKQYLAMAMEYEKQSKATGAGALPYAGGISRTDKINVQQDSDRVTPQFNIGMQDNRIPLSQIGNETPGSLSAVSGG